MSLSVQRTVVPAGQSDMHILSLCASLQGVTEQVHWLRAGRDRTHFSCRALQGLQDNI